MREREPGFHTPWLNGLHVTFENGFTVSIQWRGGNYCEHQDDLDALAKNKPKRSSNAEVAVFNPNGGWYRRDGWNDDVQGWQTPAQVLELMNHVEGLK